MFDTYLRRWKLTVDGQPITTPRAQLLPVTYGGQAAMLKIATYPAEIVGNAVMSWWVDALQKAIDSSSSTGAAPVLASDGPAILLARATEPGTLVRLLDQGRDEEAIGVITNIAAALHEPRRSPPPEDLPTLESWFTDLPAAANRLGGVLHASARAATQLLATQTHQVVLHGDLHHENILYFGDSGWLAIDPKGVLGEREFDYMQHVFDPDDEDVPGIGVLEQRLALSAELASLDYARLRLWLLAWAGLEATWWLESGGSPAPSLAVAGSLGASL